MTDVLIPPAGQKPGRRASPRAAPLPAIRPLSDRLAKLDASEVSARNHVLSALNGLRLTQDGLVLNVRARAAQPASPGLPWLIFDTGRGAIALLPIQLNRRPVLWPNKDASAALPAALSAMVLLEGLFEALEAASGLPLEPIGLGQAPPLQFELEIAAESEPPIHIVRVAVDCAQITSWDSSAAARDAPFCLSNIPLSSHLVFSSQTVPAAELSLLKASDLVLLNQPGATGWPAHLSIAGAAQLSGRYCALDGSFTCLSWNKPMPDPSHAPQSAALAEAPDWSQLDVPVRLDVRLSSIELPIRKLSGLQSGSVLDVPALGEGPEFEIAANGRTIAYGRLVMVGEGYGVLVERLAGE